MPSTTYKKEHKPLNDRWKDRISKSNILHELIQFSEGDDIITYQQAQIGLRLIGKILPDLQSQQVQVDVNHNVLNIHELNAKLVSLGQQPESVWNQLTGNRPAIEHDAINQDEPIDDESDCEQAVSISVEKTNPVQADD